MNSSVGLRRFGRIFLSVFAASGAIRAGAISNYPGGGTTINFDDLPGANCNLCGPSVTNQYAGLGVTFNNPTFPGQATADTNLTPSIPNNSPLNALFVYQGGGQTGVLPFQIVFPNPIYLVGFDW